MDTADIEFRLRQEGTSDVEKTQVPAGLLAAGQRRIRRRTTRRRAGGVLVAFVLGGGVVSLMRLSGDPSTDVAAGWCAREAGMAERNEATIPNADLAQSLALTMLAVRPNAPSFAVLDLAADTVVDYPPGEHHLPQDAVSGAAITSRGDAVVWIGSTVYVVPDADFSRSPVQIVPESVRSEEGYAAELLVVPSPDGSRLWIVQPSGSGDGRPGPTLIILVDIDTGSVLVEVEFDLELRPVGANDELLVLDAKQLIETESGWVTESGSERIVTLGIDGGLEEVGVGTGVAVHDDVIATLDPLRTRLTLIDPESDESRTVTMPTAGTWRMTGGPSIPSTALPLPSVSTTGDLLMAIGEEPDVNDKPASSVLYSISMEDGTTCSLARFASPAPVATWSRDGGAVVLVGASPLLDGEAIAVLDPGSGTEEHLVVAEVPAEHFILGAG